jgi:addiction module HigA family antidote
MTNENFKVIGQDGRELVNTDHPLHPGLIIEDEIDARKLKKKDVAKQLGIFPGHLSELINEKRSVSAMLAIKLEEVFQVEADYWLRVQNGYDLAIARRKLLKSSKKSKTSPV